MKKVLITYFSLMGKTEKMAECIAFGRIAAENAVKENIKA